jgi:hypothetical protein
MNTVFTGNSLKAVSYQPSALSWQLIAESR